jgi:hypothetical protein
MRAANLAWSAKTVEPGKAITVSADLLGFAKDKPDSASFEIVDALNPGAAAIATEAAKLEPKKGGRHAKAQWTPDAKKADMPLRVAFRLKAGTLEAMGPSIPVQRGAVVLAQFENPALHNAPSAKLGDKIKLHARVTGLLEGTEVKFLVFEHDSNKDEAVGTPVSGKTTKTTHTGQFEDVVVDWTVPRDLDVNDRGPKFEEFGDPHEEASLKVHDMQVVLQFLKNNKKITVDPGPADGALHDRTLLAVHDFKKQYKLEPADGTIDSPEFRKKLADEYELAAGKPYEPAGDDIPDYFFAVEVRGQRFQSGLLEILPAAYRVSIQVGDPGLLGMPILAFDPAVAGDKAKRKADELIAIKQRVQALGFYYEVLKKAEKDKKEGTHLGSSGDPATETELWKLARDYFETDARDGGKQVAAKDERKNKTTDADIEAADDKLRKVLVELLPKKVLVPASCDCRTTDDCKHGTVDQKTGYTMFSGQDGRIRVPGGVFFGEANDLSYGNVQTLGDYGKAGSNRYRAERRFFGANPLLGRVPIVAKVEVKYKPDDDKWRPAPDRLPVIFELIRPYTDADGTQDVRVFETLGIILNGAHTHDHWGPRQYVQAATGIGWDAKNVRRGNALKAVGGRRGSNDPRDAFLMGPTLDDLGARWPWETEPVKAGKTVAPTAVRVKTGPDGSATAAFDTGCMGGDVYKLRVRVDVQDVAAPGPEEVSAKHEQGFGEANKPAATGVLTVWRALRLERYVRKPSAPDTSIDQAMGTKIDPAIDLTYAAKELKKAFFDIEMARSLKPNQPEVLSEDDWKKAFEGAVKFLAEKQAEWKIPKYDLATLFPYPGKVADIVHARPWWEYNDKAKKDATKVDLAKDQTWTDFTTIANTFCWAVVLQLTKNALPGITLVQSLVGDNLWYGDTFTGVTFNGDGGYKTRSGTVKDPAKTKLADVSKIGGKDTKLRLSVLVKKTGEVHLTEKQGSTMHTLADYFDWIKQAYATRTGLSADKIKLIYDSHKGALTLRMAGSSDQKKNDDVWITVAVWLEHPEGGGGNWDDVDLFRRWEPWHDPNKDATTPSGIATPFRGALIFWGLERYDTRNDPDPEKRKMPYSIEANTLHELSHVLFMKHHWVQARRPGVKWWLNDKDLPVHFALDHDFNDTCVMSYHPCDGDLCGRCLLHLRGWDVNQIGPNLPGAADLATWLA